MSTDGRRRTSLNDETLRRALRPGPDVVAPADFAFTVAQAIAGRSQRRAFWGVGAGPWSRRLEFAVRLALVVALLLGLVIVAIVIGSMRERPLGGGPLLVAESDVLEVIDPATGSSTPVINDPRGIFGVARSTDGRSVSFWTGTADQAGTSLEVAGVDGSGRRSLAGNITPAPIGHGGIDVWSADDRFLATAVSVGGVDRILVVEVASGRGSLVGPDEGAGNPLWSPDGEWLAITEEHAGRPNTLGVMRRDGSELREIGAPLGANISGPDNWSSDGRWVYFDASTGTGDIYRVDVGTGVIERLTVDKTAAAPALSPDDSEVAFLAWTHTPFGEAAGVWIMRSDGFEPHLLVQYADLRGWSPDSRYVLVVARPPGGHVQLLAIAPDGTERHTLLTPSSCPEPCLESLSWGWPRP
jgi:Tol biopolymer transport system component